MFRIVLVRPGSTDYDQQERIQGALDIPLNEAGVAEVRQIVEELRPMGIETVYTSPSQPAQQAAESIANSLDVRLKRLDRLQNLDHGLWQGMQVSEVRHKQPKVYRQWQEQPENVCPPEGEMLSEAEERVAATMNKLIKRHRDGVIALVVSEPLASLVRHYLVHDELGDLWKALGDHGRWEIIDYLPPVPAMSG
jgi:broad specificity phosphatase PhoE